MKTRSQRLLIVAIFITVLGSVGAGLTLHWTHHIDDQSYSRVEDGLYIGSSVARPPQGTEAVVNLCGRPDPYTVGHSIWAPLYEAGPGVAQQEPNLDFLRGVVGFIDEERRSGRTIYVHCMLGQNRSGSVVTAYLMKEHGLGRDAALALLKSRRPMVQPDPRLMQLLVEWEQVLKAPSDARPNQSGSK